MHSFVRTAPLPIVRDSTATVVLNWQWNTHGIPVNPEATSSAYQAENLDIFGFELSDAEAQVLDNYTPKYA